jgi:hypothetical protein
VTTVAGNRADDARRVEGEWYFGNVYDEDDRPLNWWTDP